MQPGNQLLPTFQLPNPAVLARFAALAVHLQGSGTQTLPKPPIALNIHPIREREYQIQLHISPELTNDPAVCKDLHGAISAFLGRACPGTTVKSLQFTCDQNSKEGVGVFNVAVDPTTAAQESLDAALVAVMQIARFVQVVDGWRPSCARVEPLLMTRQGRR